MMTPRMVSVQGVKTPPNVPNNLVGRDLLECSFNESDLEVTIAEWMSQSYFRELNDLPIATLHVVAT